MRSSVALLALVACAYSASATRVDEGQAPARQARQLSVTTAVVYGHKDGLCREVAAAIPGARFVVVRENSIAGRVHDGNVTAIDGFLRSSAGSSHASDGPATSPPTDRLTACELQVLRLVAAGSSNKEIANALGVAVSTLERHLVNLYTKIGARGRADAIAYALRHGLDPLG